MPIPVRTIAKVSDATPEAEQRLIEFVEEQIAKMSRYASLNNDEGQIGFYELNRALAEWQNINLSLLAVYNFAKMEFIKAKEVFEDWYAEKYIAEREILNPRSISTTKWYAAKEIEMHVRSKYKLDFKRYNNEQLYADQRVSMLRRMLDGWGNQHFILSRLSKNISQEMIGSTEGGE